MRSRRALGVDVAVCAALLPAACVVAAARRVGLTSMVLWIVDPRDWADPPATTVRDRVLGAVRPGRSVLLHDGTGAHIAAALPMILGGLAARGFCTR